MHQNIRKPHSFLIFLGGRERVHWERMGKLPVLKHVKGGFTNSLNLCDETFFKSRQQR